MHGYPVMQFVQYSMPPPCSWVPAPPPSSGNVDGHHPHCATQILIGNSGKTSKRVEEVWSINLKIKPFEISEP